MISAMVAYMTAPVTRLGPVHMVPGTSRAHLLGTALFGPLGFIVGRLLSVPHWVALAVMVVASWMLGGVLGLAHWWGGGAVGPAVFWWVALVGAYAVLAAPVAPPLLGALGIVVYVTLLGFSLGVCLGARGVRLP